MSAVAIDVLAERLAHGAAALGLVLSSAQRDALLAYLTLIDKWNRVHNLTAVREPARMLALHLLDCLAVVPHLDNGAKRLLDVGTGGGLPGICIAIARPDLTVTMLDAVQKKTAFVRQAIGELGLANADVVTARVESYRPEVPFDIVISRAFADLADFASGAGHLLATGGRLLAMKGVDPVDEIARLDGAWQTRRIALAVPQLDAQRQLIVLTRPPA